MITDNGIETIRQMQNEICSLRSFLKELNDAITSPQYPIVHMDKYSCTSETLRLVRYVWYMRIKCPEAFKEWLLIANNQSI